FPNRLELWAATGDMRVGGGDLQLGSSWDRRLYDDAANYLLGISTNLYVAGRMHSTGFRLGTVATASQVLTTDASGIGTWQAAASGADNLGNHTATQLLDMSNYPVINISSAIITGAGGLSVTYGVTAASLTHTGDVTVQVDTDNNETKAFVVRDSAGNVCFAAQEDLNFYPGTYARRFYDSAANYTLNCSTHFYVDGNLQLGSNRQFKNNDDVIIRLDQNNDTVNTFKVRDGTNADRFTVTEAGRAWTSEDIQIGGNDILDSAGATVITLGAPNILTGSLRISDDLRVQGSDIYFGATQAGRKIYDDSTNYVIGVSTNLYVAGRVHAANSFRLGASAASGNVLTTDANGVGTWQAAAGGITLPIDAKGDTNVITSTGDVSVQVDTNNDETKAFVIRNSANDPCFVAREDFNFWPRTVDRRFYDDAASGNISVSTNLYVAGRFGIGVTVPRTSLHISGGFARVDRAAATDFSAASFVSGNSYYRYVLKADGLMEWGNGALARDTNLYRSAADTLKTDDDFVVGGNIRSNNFVRAANIMSCIPLYKTDADWANDYNLAAATVLPWSDAIIDGAMIESTGDIQIKIVARVSTTGGTLSIVDGATTVCSVTPAATGNCQSAWADYDFTGLRNFSLKNTGAGAMEVEQAYMYIKPANP
ncbi:MAG: hypothetical protein KKD35_01045, partial [Elusimicrobia bacterium]|nr:hypothetical protein [Elusimicrobiota bacterium]